MARKPTRSKGNHGRLRHNHADFRLHSSMYVMLLAAVFSVVDASPSRVLVEAQEKKEVERKGCKTEREPWKTPLRSCWRPTSFSLARHATVGVASLDGR